MIHHGHARFVSWTRNLSHGVGAGLILVGSLVLLGWTFDVASLKSILPGWVKMAPITAVTFVLAGVALWLLTRESANLPAPTSREQLGVVQYRTALSYAGIVAFIGLLKLSGYLLGWNLEIDQLGFTESPDMLRNSPPARMSPATALNFLLLGCALLLARSSRFIGLFQVLTLLGGLI